MKVRAALAQLGSNACVQQSLKQKGGDEGPRKPERDGGPREPHEIWAMGVGERACVGEFGFAPGAGVGCPQPPRAQTNARMTRMHQQHTSTILKNAFSALAASLKIPASANTPMMRRISSRYPLLGPGLGKAVSCCEGVFAFSWGLCAGRNPRTGAQSQRWIWECRPIKRCIGEIVHNKQGKRAQQQPRDP